MFLLKDVLKRDVLKRKVYRTVDHGPAATELNIYWEAFGPDGNLDPVAIRLGKAQHLSYDPCPEESENH